MLEKMQVVPAMPMGQTMTMADDKIISQALPLIND
jgi:hypothetical protein